MMDATAMRAEIAHLRTLATLVTDPEALAAINELIQVLELRLQRGGNGTT